MPEYERRLERHERSVVRRNQSRRVVGRWTSRRNTKSVQKAAGRTDEALATIHDFADGSVAVLRFSVQFDVHGFGIEIVKKNLNLKEILLSLLFYRRGTKPQRRTNALPVGPAN